MLIPEQIRMARAALGWTINDLADRAIVAPNTVKRIESGERARADTLDKIQCALEAGGVVFLRGGDLGGGGGPGVRLRYPRHQ